MQSRDALQYGLSFSRALALRSPRVLYLEVTKRCNAFCSFCPYWQTHDRGELTDYSPIVEKFKPFSATFTGGEPLLRRDLADIIRKITALRPKPFTACLTNGWLLSVERARQLREAGLEQVSISIDFIGEKHDEQRGLPGLYRRLDERMSELKKVGFQRIVVNHVIMESNLDHVVALARQTAKWGVYSSFSCYSTLKTDSTGELVGMRQMDELRRAVDTLKRLKKRQGNIISSEFYLDGVVEYFQNGGKLGDRCRSAGQRFFHVDPWGYVKICPEFEPFAHWTEIDTAEPTKTDCTKCWYGCRGENEAPLTVGRVRDIVLPNLRLHAA